MSDTVGIVDYGVGNLRSVANAVRVAGGNPIVLKDPAGLGGVSRLILPGVGAYGDAMANLREGGWVTPLDEFTASGSPVLGICLGMQLMAEDSEEGGHCDGLGWVPAHVRRIPEGPGVKVPHIGWNNLVIAGDAAHPLLRDIAPDADVYFVHSYRMECSDAAHVIATCNHGSPICAIMRRGNLYGMQFHPEKSQMVGVTLLRNFMGIG